MLRSAYPPGGDPLDFPDTPQGVCGRGQPPERAAEPSSPRGVSFATNEGGPLGGRPVRACARPSAPSCGSLLRYDEQASYPDLMRSPGAVQSERPRGRFAGVRRRAMPTPAKELILFTEYEDSRRWLEKRLAEALDDLQPDDRISSFTGEAPHEIGHLCCARPTPPGGPPRFP
jgi:hypothetical protein